MPSLAMSESVYGTGGSSPRPLAGVEERGHVDSDAVEMRRQPAVAVVVPNDEEALVGDRSTELLVPGDQLRGEPHDEQQRLVLRVSDGVVLDLDPVVVGSRHGAHCGMRRHRAPSASHRPCPGSSPFAGVLVRHRAARPRRGDRPALRRHRRRRAGDARRPFAGGTSCTSTSRPRRAAATATRTRATCCTSGSTTGCCVTDDEPAFYVYRMGYHDEAGMALPDRRV